MPWGENIARQKSDLEWVVRGSYYAFRHRQNVNVLLISVSQLVFAVLSRVILRKSFKLRPVWVDKVDTSQ